MIALLWLSMRDVGVSLAACAVCCALLWPLLSWLQSSGVDRVCAYLHYRTTRLKVSQRPRRIILLRHGESQGNIDKQCYQYIPDNLIQLTARGREQAAEAGRRLKALVGDESVLFYTSPFLRSQQTFRIISRSFQPHQYRVREDPRIREQEWGNLQQQPAAMSDMLRERERVGRFFYRFKDGESGADVFDRVSSFMESMFREMAVDLPVQNMVLVSHGLFMRLFLTRFYRWNVQTFTEMWNPANCEFYLLERDAKFAGFTLKSRVKRDADDAADEQDGLQQPGDSGGQAEASSCSPATPDEEKTGADSSEQQPQQRATRAAGSAAASAGSAVHGSSDIDDLQASMPLRPSLSCPVPIAAASHASPKPPPHPRRLTLAPRADSGDAFSPHLSSARSLLSAIFPSAEPLQLDQTEQHWTLGSAATQLAVFPMEAGNARQTEHSAAGGTLRPQHPQHQHQHPQQQMRRKEEAADDGEAAATAAAAVSGTRSEAFEETQRRLQREEQHELEDGGGRSRHSGEAQRQRRSH